MTSHCPPHCRPAGAELDTAGLETSSPKGPAWHIWPLGWCLGNLSSVSVLKCSLMGKGGLLHPGGTNNVVYAEHPSPSGESGILGVMLGGVFLP